MLRTRVFPIPFGLLVSCLMAVPAVGRTAAPGGFDFSASATGTALYVGPLPPGAGQAAVQAGFSGAAVSAAGPIGPIFDELGTKVATGGTGRHAEARARGIDVRGLVVGGVAEAGAPPTPAPVAAETSLVHVRDVASVSLARGEAAPVWSDRGCVAGRPSGGSARAIGVVLPVAAIDSVRSDAVTEVRPVGGRFSLVAEAHQAASSIRLLPGTAEETTVELLGETVLRARADGTPGGAALEYAAVGTDPSSPFVRITRGEEVVQFTSQEVFSGGVALAQTPVMDLRIGEAPRGFDQAGGARPYVGADGIAASAVADLVRVQLLTGGGAEGIDVRIGHLEAEVAVPSGGLRCPPVGVQSAMASGRRSAGSTPGTGRRLDAAPGPGPPGVAGRAAARHCRTGHLPAVGQPAPCPLPVGTDRRGGPCSDRWEAQG